MPIHRNTCLTLKKILSIESPRVFHYFKAKMLTKMRNKNLKFKLPVKKIQSGKPYKNRNYHDDEPIYHNVQENDLFKIPLVVLELSGTKEQESITASSTSQDDAPIYYDPEPGTTSDLSIGSLVEVVNDVSEDPMYGVIRWMGVEGKNSFILVGVELEEEQSHLPLTLTDGTHNGQRFFQCGSNRALFVPINQCHIDSRFIDGIPTPVHSLVTKDTFGKVFIINVNIILMVSAEPS